MVADNDASTSRSGGGWQKLRKLRTRRRPPLAENVAAESSQSIAGGENALPGLSVTPCETGSTEHRSGASNVLSDDESDARTPLAGPAPFDLDELKTPTVASESLKTPIAPRGAFLASLKLQRGDNAGRLRPGRTVSEPQMATTATDDQANTRTRRHLRVRVVTWNMHDNLPTGDLSDLLGAIPASAYDSEAATGSFSTASELPQIEESLSEHGLYHVIVVGGQESPGGGVAAGGVTVPNLTGFGSVGWIDILDDYLARGGARRVRQSSVPELAISPATVDSAIVETPTSVSQAGPVSAKSSQPPPSAGGRPTPALEPIAGSVIRAKDYASDRAAPPVTLETPSAPLTRANSSTGQKEPSLSAPPLLRSHPSVESIDKPFYALRHRASIESIGSISNKSITPEPAHDTFFHHHQPLVQQPVRGPYILVAKERLMGIFVCVYVLRSCQKLVTGFDKGKVTTGLVGGRLGNKGAAAISMHFAGQRMLFVIAHLAAHTGGLPIRKANVLKIKDELEINDFATSLKPRGPRLQRQNSKTEHELRDITEKFDFTFWAGDLNFRTAISRLHADWLLQTKNHSTMLKFDELGTLLSEPDNVFAGFNEAPIHFAPTYKYDLLPLRKAKSTRRMRVGIKRSSTVTGSSPMTPAPSASDAEGGTTTGGESVPRSSRASFSSTASERAEVVAAALATGEAASPARSHRRIFDIVRSKSSAQVPTIEQAELAKPSLRLDTGGKLRSEMSLDSIASPATLSAMSPEQKKALVDAIDDASFDTSKKQRVQSWTDRILYRSTVAPIAPVVQETSTLQRKLNVLVDTLKITHHHSGGKRRVSQPNTPLLQPARASIDASSSSMARSSSASSRASSEASPRRIFGRKEQRRMDVDEHGRRRSVSPEVKRRASETPAVVEPEPVSPKSSPVRLNTRPSATGAGRVIVTDASPNRSTVSSRRASLADVEVSPSSPTARRARAMSDGPPRIRIELPPTLTTQPEEESHPSNSALPNFLKPTRSRVSVNHRSADNTPTTAVDSPFSFRNWWSARVEPLLPSFATTTTEEQSAPDAPPAPEWIGPKRGEVQCLMYNSVNDLRRLEGLSDHRPVYGVYAIGLGELE